MKKALLVGINDYHTMIRLKSPLNDMLDMASYLVAEAGFRLENIHFLSDSQATRQHILDNLSQLIQQSADDDQLFFYFTGHGLQVTDHNGDEKDGLDEALVTYSKEKLEVILDDELYEIFNQLPQKVTLYTILDCCHSGVDETLGNNDKKGENSGRYVIMSASLPDQSSWQMGSKNSIRKHGYEFWEDGRYHSTFTYYSLKILRMFPEGLSCASIIEKINHYLKIHEYNQHCNIFGDAALIQAPLFLGTGQNQNPS